MPRDGNSAPSAGAAGVATPPTPAPPTGGGEMDILAMVRAAGNAALGSDNPSSPDAATRAGEPGTGAATQPADGSTEATPGTPAPDQPGGEQPATAAGEAVPAPEQTPESIRQSLRQAIKSSNIAPELKEPYIEAAFMGLEMKETGFTVPVLRTFKEM